MKTYTGFSELIVQSLRGIRPCYELQKSYDRNSFIKTKGQCVIYKFEPRFFFITLTIM